MNIDFIIHRLQGFALQFRLGRPLEITEDFVIFLTENIPELVGMKSRSKFSIQEIVSSILKCQEAEDWLGLADYLEYELPEFLNNLLRE